ncbi:hypothetical protein EJ08DRAFT_98755 [Tothia fuscella]|uniref:F-box domain-containing protein n=1 Tax=Tothia fuscella TaxID=1048955 RepID=A0A9P4TRH7_9PEZI|nr:hypothetical protein EJ08DRAFT_98755 [Tothia fuscella]
MRPIEVISKENLHLLLSNEIQQNPSFPRIQDSCCIMVPLPQETVDHILSYVRREDLPVCACISKAFQDATERTTFECVKVQSSDLDIFDQAFKHVRRRSILKKILFHVNLPSYGRENYARLEREGDRQKNNRAYSQAISRFHQILNGWGGTNVDKLISDEGGIELLQTPWSPDDLVPGRRMQSSLDGAEFNDDIWIERYKRSFLVVDNVQAIPEVAVVSTFALRAGPGKARNTHPATAAELARKMPNLREIKWAISDNEKWAKYMDARRERRTEFAQALVTIPFLHLTIFQLQFTHREPRNHGWTPHSVISAMGPNNEEHVSDPLSRALHTVTTNAPNLRKFVFKGPIVCSPEILWPARLTRGCGQERNGNGDQRTLPYWSHLEVFQVMFSAVSPDGSWAFEVGPNGPQDEESTPQPSLSDGDYESELGSFLSDDSVDRGDRVPTFVERVESGEKPSCDFRDAVKKEVFDAWLVSPRIAFCAILSFIISQVFLIALVTSERL